MGASQGTVGGQPMWAWDHLAAQLLTRLTSGVIWWRDRTHMGSSSGDQIAPCLSIRYPVTTAGYAGGAGNAF